MTDTTNVGTTTYIIESIADAGLASSDSDDNLPLQYIRNKMDTSNLKFPKGLQPRHNLKRNIIHSDTQSDTDTRITHMSTIQSQDHTAAETKTSRKRIRKEHTWKRNSRKARRSTGQAYTSVTGKTVPAKQMGPGCGSNCRMKCRDIISKEERETIFKQFYEMADYDRQRDYIAKTIQNVPRVRKKNKENSRRQWTYSWNLLIDGCLTNVCKVFYLHTLAIGDSVAYLALEKTSTEGIVQKDERGHHLNRPTKISENTIDTIRSHIKSFELVESHNVS